MKLAVLLSAVIAVYALDFGPYRQGRTDLKCQGVAHRGDLETNTVSIPGPGGATLVKVSRTTVAN